MHNAAVLGENLRQSGFFINVKDIEKPNWKIVMNEDEMKRWAQIL